MSQRFLPKLKWLITATLLCVVPSAVAARSAKPAIRIDHQDVANVEIIGKLGRPLGELVNVRGRWATAKDRSKPSSIVFLITHVDEKPLTPPVEFEVVSPIGRPMKDFKKPQNLNPESPALEWDLRGHEFGHGEFGRSSPQALQEAGVPPAARRATFNIDFEYVNARAHATNPAGDSKPR